MEIEHFKYIMESALVFHLCESMARNKQAKAGEHNQLTN